VTVEFGQDKLFFRLRERAELDPLIEARSKARREAEESARGAKINRSD
jgi:hypothetical protein